MRSSEMHGAQWYTRRNGLRRTWRKVLSVLACIVVFCTTYALILPAITMEKATFCGLEAHEHTEQCYEQVTAETVSELVCTYESLGVHSHKAECIDGEGQYVCGLADYLAHTHDASCADAAGTILCKLPEAAAHGHTDTCYETVVSPGHVHEDSCYGTEQGERICTAEEIEGHAHDDSCYTRSESPVCGQEELEGHAHAEQCSESVLVCENTDEAHVHEDGCYESQVVCATEESEGHSHGDACYESVLSCGQEVLEGHQHGTDCYGQISVLTCQLSEEPTEEKVLVCTEIAVETHVHSESCYQTTETAADTQTLTCGQEESETHTHSNLCYGTWNLICELEEHEHKLICYADTTADVETAEDWEATFADAELTGVWAEDVLTIAESQLGYQESTVNYIVLEDGKTTKGYTRYGDWYGDSYGDWCAMFVSFCLHYADVDMPLSANCQNWINTLSGEDYGLYTSAAEADPQPGDLIFFDWEGDGHADHVGLVAEVTAATEEAAAQVKTIEGNSSDRVKANTYDLTNATITGYGQLPYQLSDAEQEAVDRVIGMIDAIPSADEIDAKLAEFEAAEDYEGEEAWLTEVYQQVAEAYTYYNLLSTVQKQRVTNADKLMELEYIWSATPLAVTSARPTIYQINSYVNSSNGDAVMVFGGTVAEKVTWKFLDWYAIKVEKDTNGDLRVIEILQPGVDKSNYKANDTGFVLLFYESEVIPKASVGNYVTVHFTIPSSGVWKSEGYGTVSFSTARSGIHSDTPTKISSASTREFVELNLYDYNGYINANYWTEEKDWWYPGFQWNGGAYKKYGEANTAADLGIPNYITDRNYIDSIDFGNSLITNLTYGYGSGGDYTKAINATNVTKTSANYTGFSPINWIYGNDTEGYTNKPIGTSTTDISYTDVMLDTLKDGYPAMSDGTMLDYLFKEGTAATKLNTQSIDGLFLYDEESGAYTFNSRENHAEYVAGENRFQLYDEIITPNFITYPFGNFLPLNTIDDSSKATQVGAFNYSGGMRNYVERIIADLKNNAEGIYSDWSSSQRQLATMLEEYQENWTYYSATFNNVSNNWENLSPANAIRDYFTGAGVGDGDSPSNTTDFITQDFLDNMYNIDWDVQTNFFFGMEMKMSFYQPKDGMTGTDKDGDGDFDYPMEFNFTGDDDVWVYVDDVLFLDLSGIHRHVGGRIDFVNGKVHYYDLQPSTTGDVSSTPYKTFTFEEILTAAGKDTSVLNSKGAFKDYSTHTFKFYYMERGSGSSVCRLNFNFPLLRQNTLAVSKELTADNESIEALGNPDFKFQILNVDEKGTETTDDDVKTEDSFFAQHDDTGYQWAYTLYDTDGSLIQEVVVTEKHPDGTVKSLEVYNYESGSKVLVRKEYEQTVNNDDGSQSVETVVENYDEVYTVDANGILTLKAGQKAEFTGIPENWGRYYVRELLDASVSDLYGQIKVSGVATNKESVSVGGETFVGVESPILDMGDGSSTFTFDNKITTEKLGSLKITKKIDKNGYSGTLDDGTFKFKVTLDGNPLPAGTTYDVLDSAGTVVTDNKAVTVVTDDSGVTTSYVEISADQTAVIENILAGALFGVTELSESAKGYTVSYQVDSKTSTSGPATGTIGLDTAVTVTVTNKVSSTTVSIPVTKGFALDDGGEHTYTFQLIEVADAQGTALDGGTTQEETVTFDAQTKTFSFEPGYASHEFDSLPTTLYYKITEVDGADSLPNDQEFIAQVKVKDSGNGSGITATLEKMWVNTGEDGAFVEHTAASADFVNTLTGSLSLEKIVSGSTEDEFTFTVTILPGTSNVDPMPTEYAATLYQQDGTTENHTLTFGEDNQYVLSGFKHGEKAVIHGIPIGAVWKIEETETGGYVVGTTVTTQSGTVSGTERITTGSIESGTSVVVYTNTQTYVLPETGGAGTTSYTMAGLMLMLCSAAYLLYRFKKRRREAV